MYMLQLNDLIPPSEWEIYWTFYGDDHEGLPDDAIYVVFEYYCTNPNCSCSKIIVEIKQLGADGEPLNQNLAVINYDLSSENNKCYPTLAEGTVKTNLALDLLEVYKRFIHCDEYLTRIKNQYEKVKYLVRSKNSNQVLNKNISRNEKCPCGSNKKYKKCCLNK